MKYFFSTINQHGANFFIACLLFFSSTYGVLFAETVTGGGYTVQQVIAPLQGNLTGNGFVVQQSAQQNGGLESGGGYTLTGVFGISTSTATSTPTPTPAPSPAPLVSGGGYFIFPTVYATGTVIVHTATGTTVVIAPVGSTCSSRVTFTAPIDYGLATNVKEDVKKLERFLNEYEKEKLPINGVYELHDVAAVKRWQKKYRTFILDPMQLKQPTGTVYTLSQRQIERQTTKVCGEPVVVTACPFFKEYVSYGDRGVNVKKIQMFLNIVRGEKLPITGVYGPLTKAATKRFQQAYKKDIFSILKLSFISGNWNEATRVKANQAIGCDVVK